MAKSGKQGAVFVELGVDQVAFTALTAITTPTARAYKYFKSDSEYFSALTKYKPQVRIDGIKNGCVLYVGDDANEISVTAGAFYLKGEEYDLTAADIADVPRPNVIGEVRVTAITVDENLVLTKTSGLQGVASTTRGAAGAKPYLPLDQVLLGYITSTYSSVSAGAVYTATDIDTDSAEYANLPGTEVILHDGLDVKDNPYGCDLGTIKLSSALPQIHNSLDDATGATGTNGVRNVYCRYWSPIFEEIPDCYDAAVNKGISELAAQSYQDTYEDKVVGTPNWSGSFNFYWDSVRDLMFLAENEKRLYKIYQDVDVVDYFVGAAIMTANRSIPKDAVCDGTATLGGAGKIHHKTS
jgi:hypothetical protein